MKQDVADLLQSFRDELGAALGSNLERIILYGSRARGDEAPDSDVDVLVVLTDAGKNIKEKVHRIAYKLMWDREFQPLISLNIIDCEYYLLLQEASSSYLANILSEGERLWPASETKPNVG